MFLLVKLKHNGKIEIISFEYTSSYLIPMTDILTRHQKETLYVNVTRIATTGAGTADLSGAPDFITGF
jgi:lantibiotic modifying enzyme